jgi:AraC-like DNA-binding protein
LDAAISYAGERRTARLVEPLEACPHVRAPSLAPWRLRRIVSCIDAHLDRPIRLSELAELAGLSSSHFTRTFKNSVGSTPLSFIRHRRIERAKTLLAETSTCLAQVAQDCGFSDQAHFTRAFHALVGLPPSRWRKSIRASAAI